GPEPPLDVDPELDPPELDPPLDVDPELDPPELDPPLDVDPELDPPELDPPLDVDPELDPPPEREPLAPSQASSPASPMGGGGAHPQSIPAVDAAIDTSATSSGERALR